VVCVYKEQQNIKIERHQHRAQISSRSLSNELTDLLGVALAMLWGAVLLEAKSAAVLLEVMLLEVEPPPFALVTTLEISLSELSADVWAEA